ncbi:cytosolic thiouridylase subunit Ctu1 [Lunasporangiospora selenospora]|uniref:Cytoplasmic tRNA 2-thiolation protein 1 n=1 Tax=Lunasporangiospora selenospora TaxID=979761 RepID=A0A9P6KEN8_9FUNG|nr:cytosolic thiouridylase subunit Ctu1 [Lunasporangiospora selenospora]
MATILNEAGSTRSEPGSGSGSGPHTSAPGSRLGSGSDTPRSKNATSGKPLRNPCNICQTVRAILKRPKTGQQLCKDCFFHVFETEIHNTIVDNHLFNRGNRVAIGASGGKDSTVLAYVLKLLNDRYEYGLDLVLLSIDEGITGYRDDSLETVKRNRDQYQIPLLIVSYKDLYGWSMDDIVREIGRKNNCTFCGVFRRQALDRGAIMLNVDHIVTGHNADDIAETVLMNILRGDLPRLQRCTSIITNDTSDDSSGIETSKILRSKPFKYTYEKEIVMYAYFKKLDYFSTECIYSPNAYRGHARVFLKDLEAVRRTAIVDIIHSGEALSASVQANESTKLPTMSTCTRCGYISSNELCKACLLLEGLNKGLPQLGIGHTSKIRRMHGKDGSGTSSLSTTTTNSPELQVAPTFKAGSPLATESSGQASPAEVKILHKNVMANKAAKAQKPSKTAKKAARAGLQDIKYSAPFKDMALYTFVLVTFCVWRLYAAVSGQHLGMGGPNSKENE